LETLSQFANSHTTRMWSLVCNHLYYLLQCGRDAPSRSGKTIVRLPSYPPVVPHKLEDYYNITMQIREKVSLSTKFQDEIAMWNQRRQLVSIGVPYNHEVRPYHHYIRWHWGFFENNLFVSRASLLGDSRAHTRFIPQNEPDYPPIPQPNTQNPTHPIHTPQPNYTYYTQHI